MKQLWYYISSTLWSIGWGLILNIGYLFSTFSITVYANSIKYVAVIFKPVQSLYLHSTTLKCSSQDKLAALTCYDRAVRY